MIAAQLWQWHRVEGRTQRRGSWSVSLSLYPDMTVYISSVFSIFLCLLDLLFECNLGDATGGDNRTLPYEQVKYFILHIFRGRWTPAFLCDNTWWWMTHTHAFDFFLHQLNIHVSDFGWQYSLHSPMMVWQQSVKVADPFLLIINISVRHWFIGSILSIATEKCCNP